MQLLRSKFAIHLNVLFQFNLKHKLVLFTGSTFQDKDARKISVKSLVNECQKQYLKEVFWKVF